MRIGRVWHQEAFQGVHQKKEYFEGWYYKLIDQSRKTVFAIIPGISIGKNKADAHAFIQVINAVTGKTDYFRFPFDAFSADKSKVDVRIGDNHFTNSGLEVNLQNETTTLTGQLRFHHIEKYPTSFFHPGIMGPFSFVPNMECYHGVVNIRHTISGTLEYNKTPLEMTGGEGYIEKDWGTSFPQSWIWLQANHFETQNASFMFSIARIPWLSKTFTGLISFLRTDAGFFTFATYNRSKVQRVKMDGNQIEVILTSPKHRLSFLAQYAKGGILKAPKNGLMLREIEESITAEVQVTLTDLRGNILFQDFSKWVAMEIAGSLDEILTGDREVRK
jgi:tocopherol cyclase